MSLSISTQDIMCAWNEFKSECFWDKFKAMSKNELKWAKRAWHNKEKTSCPVVFSQLRHDISITSVLWGRQSLKFDRNRKQLCCTMLQANYKNLIYWFFYVEDTIESPWIGMCEWQIKTVEVIWQNFARGSGHWPAAEQPLPSAQAVHTKVISSLGQRWGETG